MPIPEIANGRTRSTYGVVGVETAAIQPRPIAWSASPVPMMRLAGMRSPLRDPVILTLALSGFVLMGSIVSYYNYLQYRLGDSPFSLPDTVIPFVFLIYLFGTLSANWMGRLTDRRSRRGVMMLGLGIMAVLAVLGIGMYDQIRARLS